MSWSGVLVASAGYRSLAARLLAALGGFVRGFVGAACLPGGCGHDHSQSPCHDAASARAALSEVAARRGRCC